MRVRCDELSESYAVVEFIVETNPKDDRPSITTNFIQTLLLRVCDSTTIQVLQIVSSCHSSQCRRMCFCRIAIKRKISCLMNYVFIKCDIGGFSRCTIDLPTVDIITH